MPEVYTERLVREADACEMRNGAPPPAGGKSAPAAPTGAADAPPHGKTILLWPGGAPKAVGNTPEDTPTLTIYPFTSLGADRASELAAPAGTIGLRPIKACI